MQNQIIEFTQPTQAKKHNLHAKHRYTSNRRHSSEPMLQINKQSRQQADNADDQKTIQHNKDDYVL